MKSKQDFLEMIAKYEEKTINHLINSKDRLILIRGVKFIGKTTTICSIFDKDYDYPVIYHTGCDPKKRDFANKYFEQLLEKYKDKKCLVILDEFYYPKTCEYLVNHPNFKCLLFVNTHDLEIPYFTVFNMIDFFEQNKKDFFGSDTPFEWKDRNIREITYFYDHPILDVKDFNQTQNELDALRRKTNYTQTKIKENGTLFIETITFGEENVISHTTEKL